ncbi:MAG: hypothetical protein KDD51_05605 [Bdellovibrionales bacterium]|nr:hypothetical protein [Bdellovibrionales bacterium]
MKFKWLLLLSAVARADEIIDLSDLGAGTFSPYVLERDPLWILLPVLLIAVIVWHLRKPKRKVFPGEQPHETHEDSTSNPNVLPLHRE